MNLKCAAILATIATAGIAAPNAASAQAANNLPLFTAGFPNVLRGMNLPCAYGGCQAGGRVHAGGYGYRVPARQHVRRVVGSFATAATTEVTVVEHPFAGSKRQYRCFPDGRPSGGPGTGTGWCKR